METYVYDLSEANIVYGAFARELRAELPQSVMVNTPDSQEKLDEATKHVLHIFVSRGLLSCVEALSKHRSLKRMASQTEYVSENSVIRLKMDFDRANKLLDVVALSDKAKAHVHLNAWDNVEVLLNSVIDRFKAGALEGGFSHLPVSTLEGLLEQEAAGFLRKIEVERTFLRNKFSDVYCLDEDEFQQIEP